MRETFSPGTVRSRAPAPSSAVSISASAVESHACSALPDRFLKPRTATDRRTAGAGVLAGTAAVPVTRVSADCFVHR